MKTKAILLLVVFATIYSCKKEKSSTPAAPAPATLSVTVKIGIFNSSGCPTVISPNVTAVFVSPTGVMGDTASITSITDVSPLMTCPSTDAVALAAFTAHPSASLTFSLVDDGSYYRLYVKEGSTFLRAYRIYADGNLSSDSGAIGVCATDYFAYSSNLVVVGW